MERELTFKDGFFLLKTNKRFRSSYWREVESGIYRTSNLKAAASLKDFADEKTLRIFKRAFNQFYKVPKLPPLTFLDPHQLAGVNWILSRSRAYLAHAPGAGKTAQAIVAACLIQGCGQTVFIVPPSLTLNWEREVWKFTDGLEPWPTVAIVPQSAKREEMDWMAEFIIVPDSMLAKSWVYENLRRLPIKLLAVDEASRFKDPLAERSIALYGGTVKGRKFGGIFQGVRHTVFMDGSPMPNRPMELWAPTFALSPLTIDCMDQDDFGFRYCGATQTDRGTWEFKHSNNEAELHQKLTKDFMHVVTENKLKHPERRRSLLYMSEDVRSLEQKTWERKHLRSMSLDDIDEGMNRGEIVTFRRELGLRKVPWIANYVRGRLEEKNESILLFAWHREVCQKLVEALHKFNPGLVMGGTHSGDREILFRQFQAGKRKLIVGNIGAMGRGHNLQRADRVIFGEYSWTDELNKQCEKRASRRGRAEEAFVRCEYIVAPDSMDEPILNAVFTKMTRVKKVIG